MVEGVQQGPVLVGTFFSRAEPFLPLTLGKPLQPSPSSPAADLRPAFWAAGTQNKARRLWLGRFCVMLARGATPMHQKRTRPVAFATLPCTSPDTEGVAGNRFG